MFLIKRVKLRKINCESKENKEKSHVSSIDYETIFPTHSKECNKTLPSNRS